MSIENQNEAGGRYFVYCNVCGAIPPNNLTHAQALTEAHRHNTDTIGHYAEARVSHNDEETFEK